jgi:hypothetical protein
MILVQRFAFYCPSRIAVLPQRLGSCRLVKEIDSMFQPSRPALGSYVSRWRTIDSQNDPCWSKFREIIYEGRYRSMLACRHQFQVICFVRVWIIRFVYTDASGRRDLRVCSPGDYLTHLLD